MTDREGELDGEKEIDPGSPAPEPGEVRFYKKVYATPTRDVLVPVQDCGCWLATRPTPRPRRPQAPAGPADGVRTGRSGGALPKSRATLGTTMVETALRSLLEETPEVQLAVLFGSRARGGARPDSDADMALRVSAMEPQRLSRLLADLERAASHPLDIVFLDEAAPLLAFEIARDGVVVLERAPHAWSDFRARAFLEWLEWAPYAETFSTAAVARLKAEVGRGPP
jgi:predicted nucleotidyltransferase